MNSIAPRQTAGFLFLAFLYLAVAAPLRAEDRDGWLVVVQKKTLSRGDSQPIYSFREIDRDLVLKANIKNLSMKDREAGYVEYAILIRRWGGETGAIERHSGKIDLKPMKKAEEIELNTGKFHIGGHLHGTSRMHVDDLEAWKFTVVVGDKKTEFRSSQKFEELNAKARPPSSMESN